METVEDVMERLGLTDPVMAQAHIEMAQWAEKRKQGLRIPPRIQAELLQAARFGRESLPPTEEDKRRLAARFRDEAAASRERATDLLERAIMLEADAARLDPSRGSDGNGND